MEVEEVEVEVEVVGVMGGINTLRVRWCVGEETGRWGKSYMAYSSLERRFNFSNFHVLMYDLLARRFFCGLSKE